MKTNENANSREPEVRKRGRPRLYPFDELKPGEQFLVAGKVRNQIAPSLYAAERRTGFVFHAMNTPDGVLVFRALPEFEERLNELKSLRRSRREARRNVRLSRELRLGVQT